jgi:hypothetical protein
MMNSDDAMRIERGKQCRVQIAAAVLLLLQSALLCFCYSKKMITQGATRRSFNDQSVVVFQPLLFGAADAGAATRLLSLAFESPWRDRK